MQIKTDISSHCYFLQIYILSQTNDPFSKQFSNGDCFILYALPNFLTSITSLLPKLQTPAKQEAAAQHESTLSSTVFHYISYEVKARS